MVHIHILMDFQNVVLSPYHYVIYVIFKVMYLTNIGVLFYQSEGLTPEDAVLVIQRYYRSWRHGEKPPSNQKHRRKSNRPAPVHQQQVSRAPDRQAELISFSHNVSYNSLCHW